MSTTLLYQWENEIASFLPILNSWQQANVALFSYGVIRSRSCQQVRVSDQLVEDLGGVSESYERRFQRFLANAGWDVSAVCRLWMGWVWRAVGCPQKWTLLVDETKLSDHLSIMLLGVAYQQRCIPLVWHCYHVSAYPRCGQVGLVLNLLLQVQRVLPAEVDVLVQADRGIGTSPQLCRWIDELLGWRYLFRVTCQTKIVTEAGDYTIAQQVQPGEIWCASGKLFKKRGQIPGYALALWTPGYKEPWGLVTNDPQLTGYEYAHRNWQEQSFKDLKSGGWHWGESHVWSPRHARRLLVLLALAYGWMLLLGSQVFHADEQARPVQSPQRPPQRRYSIFREGLRRFHQLYRQPITPCLDFRFYALAPPL